VLQRPCLLRPLPLSHFLRTHDFTQYQTTTTIQMCFKIFCDLVSSCVPCKRPATHLYHSTFYTHPNAPLRPASSSSGAQVQQNSQGRSRLCPTWIVGPELITHPVTAVTSQDARTEDARSERAVNDNLQLSPHTITPVPASSQVVAAATTTGGSAGRSSATSATSQAPVAPVRRAALPDPLAPPPDKSRPFDYSHVPCRL
jgi:hypothetical protein